MRIFGSELGFKLAGGPTKGSEPGGGRVNLIWTMVKDANKSDWEKAMEIELTDQ